MNVKIRNNRFRRNYNNFGLYSERAKWRLVHEPETREFFWRTAQQQEVDSGVNGWERPINGELGTKSVLLLISCPN